MTSIYIQAYRRFIKASRLSKLGHQFLAAGYEDVGGEALSLAVELSDVLHAHPEFLAPCTDFRISMRKLGLARQRGLSGWRHRFRARRIAKQLELLRLP